MGRGSEGGVSAPTTIAAAWRVVDDTAICGRSTVYVYRWADGETTIEVDHDGYEERAEVSIPTAIVAAMHKAVDELAVRNTFRGYGPEQGYDFLRQAIVDNDFKARGCDIALDEVFDDPHAAVAFTDLDQGNDAGLPEPLPASRDRPVAGAEVTRLVPGLLAHVHHHGPAGDGAARPRLGEHRAAEETLGEPE